MLIQLYFDNWIWQKDYGLQYSTTNSLAHMLTPAQMTIYSLGCFFTKDSFNKTTCEIVWNGFTAGQVQRKNRGTTTTTQSFGLAGFPNNAYEAMKLTKGNVSHRLVFNLKKTLKKAINEKYQQNTNLICKLKKCIR